MKNSFTLFDKVTKLFQTKLGDFFQILWPSQNTRTVTPEIWHELNWNQFFNFDYRISVGTGLINFMIFCTLICCWSLINFVQHGVLYVMG